MEDQLPLSFHPENGGGLFCIKRRHKTEDHLRILIKDGETDGSTVTLKHVTANVILNYTNFLYLWLIFINQRFLCVILVLIFSDYGLLNVLTVQKNLIVWRYSAAPLCVK